MTMRQLETVLYFESYIVVDPGETKLKEKELLTGEEYRKRVQEFGDKFKAGIGAEAVKVLLQKINLDTLAKDIRAKIRQTNAKTTKEKLAKRLKVVEAFRRSGNRPEWMVMDVIPVLPPDLRPLVPLEGGRFATSDLNDLYRRVINRNISLKRLMALNAPSVIIRNEKRMLQEAVDALFDNGRRSRVLKAVTKRPLKSLSDMIKGKEGRFRQNLLGKRVDYSGRSVIVPDPALRLHQCGLPKKMAIEMFKPYIFSKLEEKGFVTTIKAAKKVVERGEDIIWDCLDEVIREHPVLLNRMPTLHCLGMQAFDPVLVEGKAIKLHPLVCKGFNADFDGDQMAVHVPLSIEAQVEARALMMSVNTILNPANGKPAAMPTQDMLLGIYYLTADMPDAETCPSVFSSADEVRHAYDSGFINEHSKIKVRIQESLHDTTAGKVILYDIFPCGFPFEKVNRTVTQNCLEEIVMLLHNDFGRQDTAEVLDRLMRIGFEYATRSGISISMDDIRVPSCKQAVVEDAQKHVYGFINANESEDDETISTEERRDAVTETWQKAAGIINNEIVTELKKDKGNNIHMMINSGAKNSAALLIRLAGMVPGHIVKPSEKFMEYPITANFKEGLSPVQYFMLSTGARNSIIDTEMMTANAGWLTRRLIDVVQDTIIQKEDCATGDGITLDEIVVNKKIIHKLDDRITGRISAEEIRNPETGEVILGLNEEITNSVARRITDAGIKKVRARSVLTCLSENGVCARCYGRDLSTGRTVETGTAVGILAAQSIGEPGTQFVLNSRRSGRCETEDEMPVIDLFRIIELFEARRPKDKTLIDPHKILNDKGGREVHLFLLNELQKTYKANNIKINDKHFEIIIRKMTEKIKITAPGDTMFLMGEITERRKFLEENVVVSLDGGKEAVGQPVLLGITKAALSANSWISAASFQETTRILTEAAIEGDVDHLKGLKENVIMGRLIPAGTGFEKYKDTFVQSDLDNNENGEMIDSDRKSVV